MMGFVTVSVDQHDVTRGQQSLLDHLVRRGSAVGDKKDVVCPECPGSFLLSNLDVSRRLQEAVEPARSCGRLGKKQVQPVELAHVTNPIRLENRLTSCDGQGVKSTNGPLSVFLQVIEVRGVIPVCDAVEDAQMQFERLLNLIEDTTDASPTDVTGKLFRFPVTQKINVKFRTKQLQSLSKRQSKLPRLLINVAGRQMCGQEFTQDRSEEHTSELQSPVHLVCRLL